MDIFVFFQHLLVLPIPLKNSLFAFQSSLLRVHAMIMPIHTWTLHPHAADSTICWVYDLIERPPLFHVQVGFREDAHASVPDREVHITGSKSWRSKL